MASMMQVAQICAPIYDEVYTAECKTSILDGDETLVQKGANGEIKIAKLEMDGLGDFDRNEGYTKGTTKLIWETIKYDKERSQEFRVDRLTLAESLSSAFSKLGSEFIRTKVIPETDSARIAKISSASNISKKEESLTTGEEVVKALRACSSKMDADEVSSENRILFIVGTYKDLVDDLDTTKSKKVLDKFSQIIEMPQSRMYTAIELQDGKTNYGYKKAPDGKELNFLCVEKSAAVTAMDQYIKGFDPDQDQIADDNVLKYRNNNLYGHVYENKTAGVYASYQPAGVEG